MFYECYGSKFSIDREYGNAYWKCNVPNEIEYAWLEDIKNNLSYKIKTSHGAEQHTYVTYICQILSTEKSIDLLLSLLNTDNDCFTKLLYCEHIKHLSIRMTDKIKHDNIVRIIKEQKQLILSDISNIDAEYKISQYMRNYDFSVDNLIKRIEKL